MSRNQLSCTVARATRLQRLLLVITPQRNAESWTEICVMVGREKTAQGCWQWYYFFLNKPSFMAAFFNYPCSTFPQCSFVSNSPSVGRNFSLSPTLFLLPITFALFADCLEKQGFCIHQFPNFFSCSKTRLVVVAGTIYHVPLVNTKRCWHWLSRTWL